MVSRLNQQVFNSSGSFTVPSGVSFVRLTGYGGGGGGGGGQGGGTTASVFSNGGGGGAGSVAQTLAVSVTPGSVITVTIGAGGTGGTGGIPNNAGVTGGNGGDTIFGLIPFSGAGGGFRGDDLGSSGGLPVKSKYRQIIIGSGASALLFDTFDQQPQAGGNGAYQVFGQSTFQIAGAGIGSTFGSAGGSGGATGANSTTNFGGGGGGGGGSGALPGSTGGVGGTGGAGSSGTGANGVVGANGAANSGTGGGGGGGGGTGPSSGGSGGNGGTGGSGKLIVEWIDG